MQLISFLKGLLLLIQAAVASYRKVDDTVFKEKLADEIKKKDNELTASELADALGLLHKGDSK